MRGTRFIAGTAAVCAVTVLAACQDDTLTNAGPDGAFNAPQLSVSEGEDPAEQLTNIMDAINAQLATDGANYRVAMVEFVTGGPDADEAGAVILQKDVGNKQLGFDFVPGDTRRAWSGSGATAITYSIDTTGDAVPVFGGLNGAQTDAAITRGHGTWEGLVCSNPGQSRNPDFGIDIGVVAFLNGLGGSPFIFADVQHAGWRDINFGGGVLGATFTFGFTSGGVFTDIDGNGKLDAAFREIYYDPSFSWADDGVSNVDVETVALHEIGHGLSQAHFGNIFIKKGNATASPRAVMNAFIFGVDRELFGTDNGGHCSNWAQWPNN